MQPLAVVEDLQVFKEDGSGFLPGGKEVVLHTLSLYGTPKGFHHRIVPAIPFTTHAQGNAAVSEEGAIGMAGILTAPVTVMDEALDGLAMTERHLQCGDD